MTTARPPAIQSPALGRYTMHLRHGFFGRQGGVSNGIYRSLNCGPGSSDDPANVQANRDRVCVALGGAAGRMVTARQEHTARAIWVDAPLPPSALPVADAVATRTPGLVVAALAADCAPVLLAEPHAGMVAAIHAGWRGALDGVTDACVDLLVRSGGDPDRMVAAVGPCLSQASFEVGPDLVDAFLERSPWAESLFAPGAGDRSHFDLKEYIVRRLVRCGVRVCEALADDTLTEPDAYFSARRSRKAGEPDYGRNVSAIMLLAD